jgi:hypothetical protein
MHTSEDQWRKGAGIADATRGAGCSETKHTDGLPSLCPVTGDGSILHLRKVKLALDY